ncbi:MAG TPA: hypothetical protein PLR06_04220 [Cyclobacteriaceae bacterium]|nr:hypothetical protein [Cyclobacteriaceae bacterium]
MNDKLEKFLRENREQMDDRIPQPGIWNRIAASLFERKNTFLLDSLTFWRAAAFLLLGLSVYLFVSRPSDMPMNRQVSQQEFNDVELFYSSQITEKVALISSEGPFADDSFTQDIQKLEAMYSVLAEEMKRQPSDRVKDALVLNMLVRIDLLNQQIQKLEESKREKQEASSI